MAEYILHDGIDEDFHSSSNHGREADQLRYAQGATPGALPLSTLMLAATDDLEIPLINVS